MEIIQVNTDKNKLDFSFVNKINIMSKITISKDLPHYLPVSFMGEKIIPEVITREGVMTRNWDNKLTLIEWKHISEIENF